MSSSKPAQIHHILVAMPQGGEDEARRFYGELLGFPEIPKPENLLKRGGVWFLTGNLQLHLGVDRSFVPATKAHVAYQVDDLEALRGRLVAAGLGITDDEPLPGYDRCYVEDPFGNRIELVEPIS
jgi:catechol 2,3-dioxygenase-like lactoylglutathione lyase family enzyme